MKMRGKVDRNHVEIVRALRLAGATVLNTSNLGSGAPDIVVGFRGQNWLFEIKDCLLPPSKRQLTPDEKLFHGGWKGQIRVIETTDDAFKAIGLT